VVVHALRHAQQGDQLCTQRSVLVASCELQRAPRAASARRRMALAAGKTRASARTAAASMLILMTKSEGRPPKNAAAAARACAQRLRAARRCLQRVAAHSSALEAAPRTRGQRQRLQRLPLSEPGTRWSARLRVCGLTRRTARPAPPAAPHRCAAPSAPPCCSAACGGAAPRTRAWPPPPRRQRSRAAAPRPRAPWERARQDSLRLVAGALQHQHAHALRAQPATQRAQRAGCVSSEPAKKEGTLSRQCYARLRPRRAAARLLRAPRAQP
jgi:hypothetical protein